MNARQRAPLGLLWKSNEAIGMRQHAGGARLAVNPNNFYFKNSSCCVNKLCKYVDATFWARPKGIPMPWKELLEHQTKYIHQLSTPYPISGTLFGFEIRWWEPKLRDKVIGPKRGH
jgi:hypothetical protein